MGVVRYHLTSCTRRALAPRLSNSLEQASIFESKLPERPRLPCRSSDVSRRRSAGVKNINSRCRRRATGMRSQTSGAAQRTRCFISDERHRMEDRRMHHLHLLGRGDKVQ